MKRNMRRLAMVLALAWTLAAQSEDAQLGQIRALLAPFRANPRANLETRGATPEFDRIKHSLRDWVESKITALKPNADVGPLERKLNNDLSKAGLLCEAGKGCPDQNPLGFLGEIELRWEWEYLVAQTGVGIQDCGLDESAYAYRRTGERWERFWQDEQNEYAEKEYAPRAIDGVLFSPTPYEPGADKNQRLILTLGRHEWCTSNWRPVYYRIWQTSSRLKEPKLLLDENQVAFLADPIQGSVSADDVLIEFSAQSIDAGVLTRREVRHYALHHGRMERADPLVLGPRDFADEWITRPWAESSHWTDPRAGPQLEKWHQRNTAKGGEFLYPTRHCPQRPDLWQVGIDFSNGDGRSDVAAEYFLIRWRPPYHFTMVDVSPYPWPDCSEEDREADEPRTLFLQSWHN